MREQTGLTTRAICFYLLIATALVLRSTGGFPNITVRNVRVHLNVLKLKHSDYARSHIDDSSSEEYDIAGGFAWQNRVLIPAVLWLVNSVAERMPAPISQRFLGTRIFYLLLFMLIIYGMYRTLYWYSGSFFEKDGYLSHISVFIFSLYVFLIITESRTIKLASDYLQVILFALAIHYSLRKRIIILLFLTIIETLVRESSLFFGIIYYILNIPSAPSDKRLSFLRSCFQPKIIAHSIILIAVAFIVTIGLRAYFLGGLQYAFGIGLGYAILGVEGHYSWILFTLKSNMPSMTTANSWFIITSLFAISLYGLRNRNSIDRRLVLCGVIIFLLSIPIGSFAEPRVFLPLVLTMIIPFANSIGYIFHFEKIYAPDKA